MAETDQRLFTFSYFVAAISMVLGIVHQQYVFAFLGPLLLLSLLKLTIEFVSNRTAKTILVSIFWMFWVGLTLMLSRGLDEVRYMFFIFLFILIIYQSTNVLLVASGIACLYIAGMYFTYFDENWMFAQFVHDYVIKKEGLTLIRLNITTMCTLMGCASALWLAYCFEIRTKLNFVNEILNQQKNQIFSKNRSFANSISNGELTVAYQPDEDDDLGKALVEMRHNLLIASEKEKEEKFAATGYAKVSDILRNHLEDLQAMTDELLKFLVGYIKSTQGNIFILNVKEDGSQALELSSTYAFNRKKHFKKEVMIGEGLVGQCFLEKEYILLNKVPEGYLKIRSGLGDASPRSVLLVPLKSNEEVVGILELASFNLFKEHEIKFLEKLSEEIASTVIASRSNERTKSLLLESQELTEQMNSQKEEMRQNMEEMQATQEEMRRLTIEMEGQVNAINSTMATIEFDLTGHVLNANENFLKLMGYQIEEIRGKHHRIFVEESEKRSELYKEFWEKLGAGQSYSGEFKRLNKSGEEVYIKGIYNPSLNEKGEPERIIKLAYDITNEKKLYLNSQQQLQQVIEQESALKKSLEEMKMARDKIEKMSNEMESQIYAINSTVATIQFDLNGNILTANDIFLDLMGYELSEVQGKHHRIFMGWGEHLQSSYAEFWKALSEGRSAKGEFKRITKGGREILIQGIYNPVLDQSGKPVRIFKLAYDITEKKLLEKQLSELKGQHE